MSQAVEFVRMVAQNSVFTREEVSKHCRPDDLWLILNGEVYDVTRWADHHPGGRAILHNHGGDDASVAFDSFHVNKDKTKKYLKSYKIGSVVEDERELSNVVKDFRKLRKDLESKGYFSVNALYYWLYLLHCFCLALPAGLLLWYFKTFWVTWILAVVLAAASYLQCSSLLHDGSHLSLSPSIRHNHWLTSIFGGILLGFSGHWWKHKHNQHHAKPNVYAKDPDITTPLDFFLFGDEVAVDRGRKGQAWMPYHLQHLYFFIFGPPTYLTCYGPVEALWHTLKYGVWGESVQLILHYVAAVGLYNWLLGDIWSAVTFHFTMRLIASHWWVWITQVSHIPMPVHHTHCQDWVTQQISTTCNVESSVFTDWFMCHLNFQIEHHFFPTMPRHNFHSVTPYVREFCKRHGLHYTIKPNLWTAARDVVSSMKRSGNIWLQELIKTRNSEKKLNYEQ